MKGEDYINYVGLTEKENNLYITERVGSNCNASNFIREGHGSDVG